MRIFCKAVGVLLIGLVCQMQFAVAADATGAPVPKSAGTEPMSMGFSPKEFQARFNRQAIERKAEFRVTSTQLKALTEVADQWVYQFDNNLAFLAPVNRKDGTIRSLTYVARGDGSLESGARLLFALSLLVRSVDPALTDKTANALVGNLMDAAKNGGKPIERVQNGVRYASATAEGVGFMVAINPVQ